MMENSAAGKSSLSLDPHSINLTSRLTFLDCLPKGLVCAELGVYRGVYSEAILKRSCPRKLHLIDRWKCYPQLKKSQRTWDVIYKNVLTKFAPHIAKGVVVVHRTTTSQASTYFHPNYFDWIYIDGDHTEDGVEADLLDYGDSVKVGGLIFLDDYFDEPLPSEVPRGVIPAVAALLKRDSRYEFVGTTVEQGNPGCLLWKTG